jgi:hypothetical protein
MFASVCMIWVIENKPSCLGTIKEKNLGHKINWPKPISWTIIGGVILFHTLQQTPTSHNQYFQTSHTCQQGKYSADNSKLSLSRSLGNELISLSSSFQA